MTVEDSTLIPLDEERLKFSIEMALHDVSYYNGRRQKADKRYIAGKVIEHFRISGIWVYSTPNKWEGHRVMRYRPEPEKDAEEPPAKPDPLASR